MLEKSMMKLSKNERILLAEELWDSVALQGVKVSDDEKGYVKNRLDDLKKRPYKKVAWSVTRSKMGLK